MLLAGLFWLELLKKKKNTFPPWGKYTRKQQYRCHYIVLKFLSVTRFEQLTEGATMPQRNLEKSTGTLNAETSVGTELFCFRETQNLRAVYCPTHGKSRAFFEVPSPERSAMSLPLSWRYGADWPFSSATDGPCELHKTEDAYEAYSLHLTHLSWRGFQYPGLVVWHYS